jgi:hypothetical protein
MVFMEGFDLTDESLHDPPIQCGLPRTKEREDASSKPHFRNGLR